MTKNEKKEIFLLILENWFNDTTGQINSENCIGFYNYFLDSLEFESKFSPEYALGFHAFLIAFIEWLSAFDKYFEIELNKKHLREPDGLKNIGSNFSVVKEPEKLELFLSILKDLYIMAKGEYLL